MHNLEVPIKMQASKVFKIDVETFIAICRFSYSIYAVLQSLSWIYCRERIENKLILQSAIVDF